MNSGQWVFFCHKNKIYPLWKNKRITWWIWHLESCFWHHKRFPCHALKSLFSVPCFHGKCRWELILALGWAHPEPLSSASAQRNLLLQGSKTVFLYKLQHIWFLPFCCCLQALLSMISLKLTSLIFLQPSISQIPLKTKTPCETGNRLFFISDGVSGLIMNFESLLIGYLLSWEGKPPHFNWVWMDLTLHLLPPILQRFQLSARKIFLRTQWVSQPYPGCSEETELF